MKVYVDESPAGAGKTEDAIARIVAKKVKVLFVTERIESFPELRNRIGKAAARVGSSPRIREIHAATPNRGRSVITEVESLPEFYLTTDHVIVMITHAAMLRADYEGFSGWEMVIDEVPNFLASQTVSTSLDRPYFERFYQLSELSGPWSAVTLTDDGRKLSAAHVRDDDSHSYLSNFHQRVIEASRPNAHRQVLCNLPHFGGMEDRAVSWIWASTFSMLQLKHFDRVELLGNRFLSNIATRLVKFLDGEQVEWIKLPNLKSARPYARRNVHIHYFSERPGSASWLTGSGADLIKEIGCYLSKALPTGRSIWSTNNCLRELLDAQLDSGDYVRPRQAGTNQYQRLSSAAIIYTAKPSPEMEGLLVALDQNRSAWIESVEHEAVLQFLTRTSIRDPQSSAPVDLYVFDKAQAEYLATYFSSLGHASISLTQVPLKTPIPSKMTPGRKRKKLSAEEAEARAERTKELNRDRTRRWRQKRTIMRDSAL
jgi:hypothetical protein